MATRTYTCNSVSDRSSNNAAMTVAGNKFVESGDTTSIIGSVSSFTIKHFHTQTANKTTAKWGLSATITFGNGDTLTSDADSQTYACGNNGREWTNTFTIASANQEEFGEKLREHGIASITINIDTKPSNGGYLYWQATSSRPMTIEAVFTAYSGASPRITNWEVSWPTTRDLYQNQMIDFEFDVSIDPLTGGTDPNVTLSINGSSYSNPVLRSDTSGQITGGTFADIMVTSTKNNFTLRVTDDAGKTGILQNSFTALAHTKPVISSFGARRYLNNGGTIEYTDLGTHVCLTIDVSPLSAGTIVLKDGTTTQNTGSLTLQITDVGSDSSTWQTITNSLSSSSGYSVTDDTTIDTDTRYTGAIYVYRLVATDIFSSTEATATVGSTSAIVNIEKKGVAIGKLWSQGTADNPILDIGMETVFASNVPVKLCGYNMNYASQTEMLTIATVNMDAWSWTGGPRITRVGPLVYLSGGVITASGGITIQDNIVCKLAKIPDWAKPESYVNVVQTGHNTGYIFNIGIEYDYASSDDYWIYIRHPTAPYTIQGDVGIYLNCSWIARDAFLRAT